MTPVRGDQMLLMMSDFYYPDQKCPQIVLKNKGEEAKEGRRQKRLKKREDQGVEPSKRRFTKEQANHLELSFRREQKLDKDRKHKLASEINLEPRQVSVWFQNRRQRWKNKRMKQDYSMMKAQFQSTVVGKRQLETEVLKLKEKVCELEMENQRLTKRPDIRAPIHSSSSTFSVEAMEPSSLWDSGMQGLEEILSVPENNTVEGMEWLGLI